jgi:hypothetical protein
VTAEKTNETKNVSRLVMNGMKLQPCRPTFFNARDSIIQADQVLTGGENFCELWEAFAQRGLGPDASANLRTPWTKGTRVDVGYFFLKFMIVCLLSFFSSLGFPGASDLQERAIFRGGWCLELGSTLRKCSMLL